jgi:hypothetical protein
MRPGFRFDQIPTTWIACTVNNLIRENLLSARPLTVLTERSDLRVTVTVDGRRWRKLPNVEALRAAASDSLVYVLDAATGGVRFGNGVHGARPPNGTRVRVLYRDGGGAAGNVFVSWEGDWPPRAFAFAKSIAPSCLAMRSVDRRAKRESASR